MPDEVVLALDLYLREGMAHRADWDALSNELRALPVEQHLAVDQTFRNWEGVRNKLYNLQWLDTDGAQGRENAGAPTIAVWGEFGRDAQRVADAAMVIRHAFDDARLQTEQVVVDDDDYEADESVVVVEHACIRLPLWMRTDAVGASFPGTPDRRYCSEGACTSSVCDSPPGSQGSSVRAGAAVARNR
jgi:hypothetical protein